MASKVGSKGQVVIEKAIRDQLGIQPGSLAIQRVVDGRLEIRFAPPLHRRSLRGILQPYITRMVPEDQREELEARAWEEGVIYSEGVELRSTTQR